VSVHVFETMGTVASLRSGEGDLSVAALDAVERIFETDDRRFSLYDPDSPLSRIARGDLSLPAADPAVRDAYALALDWRGRTGGAFTPHRPDGVVDLSGVVKAVAIATAGDALDRWSGHWLLSVGGDVLARGLNHASAWRVGVVDPDDRGRLAALVALTGSRRAVATSGTAERGDHLWRRGGERFTQVTVAADDIVTADVLATAIAAGDERDLDRITAEYDIDVLTFDTAGEARATPAACSWLQHSLPRPLADL
jgi:thiamine biosynthesis lipoprotein